MELTPHFLHYDLVSIQKRLEGGEQDSFAGIIHRRVFCMVPFDTKLDYLLMTEVCGVNMSNEF